ncbi:hypothetical protein HII31_08184 [Pseudocercospora fuligena]|uniref:F-box domain-containing protein n=1 Tax=Pseudocercospora fuligena TaxID=685502 RepID=A0A8H6REQ2_9PEZI|nr:hypothetical protein HII31_08184 [Pseudocercospora fuligena]
MIRRRPVLGRFVVIMSTKNNLDRLPDEVILHILSYLETADLVHLHLVASRYLTLGRDNTLWKTLAFDRSRAEALRRRRDWLAAQAPSLAELRNAVTALPGANLTATDVAQLIGRPGQQHASSDPASEARVQRQRAFANWEPGYPIERIDYYEVFIHRHAPIDVAWIDLPNQHVSDRDELREVTGIGLLRDQQDLCRETAVAPLDDGSLCLWDLSARSTDHNGGGGRLLAQSKPGLLSGRPPSSVSESHAIMTETGAVECVSIDHSASKGYCGVQNLLHEVDLNTLSISSTKEYPFPITALSEVQGRQPLTVGTNMTVHLYDPRDPAFMTGEASSGGELIGGSVYSHATLAQPGPLSILHHGDAEDSSIWVAGRFTSLLNYDRRFFPRLRGTVFSGARISCLSSIPHPFLPRDLDLLRNPQATISARLEAKSGLGTTLMAAAEYKGKGSLELYGLPGMQNYLNRQTASATKLLSVAPQGGRIVISDGDGHIKWMERDGFTYARTFNINDVLPKQETTSRQYTNPRADSAEATQGAEQIAGPAGLLQTEADQDDIVQKIVPLGSNSSGMVYGSGRIDINQNKLLLWTGDGKLGVLGFGQRNPLGGEDWHDALEDQSQAMSVEERAREDAEKQYGMAMRRALKRNADEVRFVRGLGMGAL